MLKRLQAFFPNENDAESAAAQLQKLKVSNVLVDTLPETGYKVALVPAANNGLNGLGAGIPGTSKVSAPGILKSKKLFKEEDENVTHVLEFEIAEEEVGLAIMELRETNALMDKTLIEEFNNKE